MIEEGTILQKRYRVEKQIGQGGMGAVYVATDERFGSTVAIKETLFTDKHYQKAFKREARLLNSLKHSALPKVSDHFVEDNGQYIVMEYIGGDDLFEEMEKKGTAFQYEDVLNWTHQLLDALEYLHGQENPVIHRDIKPQNLKLTSEGNIILLDFGLAKGNPTDANHKTAANSIFGYSPNYASLEQIQGTGTDPRSDFYSLAATMYHLLVGKPPADALTRVMLVLNEEKDPLQPVHKVYEHIPEGFSQLLQRTMSLNANMRPQTTSEMREMLVEIKEIGSFTAPITTPTKPHETNLFSQDTKVMSGEPEAENISKTERKTEVLPVIAVGQESVKTRIANPETAVPLKSSTLSGGIITRSFPNRSGQVIASVLGLLVLAGSILAGAYFVNPEMFGYSTSADETEDSKSTDVKSLKKNDVEIVNTNSSNQGTNSNSTEIQPPSQDMTTVSAPLKKTRDKKTKVKSKKPRQTELTLSKGDVKITKGKTVTKHTKLTKGRVETKDVIVDGNNITLKNRPRPLRPRFPMTRKEYERLTPAQKRKVRKARDDKRRRDRIKRLQKKRQYPKYPPKKPKY